MRTMKGLWVGLGLAVAMAAACDGYEGVPKQVGVLMEALTGESCDPGNAAGVVTPSHKAMLDTIAWAEGTRGYSKDGYNVHYSHQLFARCDQHPNRVICAGAYCSDAAGRYQFLKSTWDGLRLPNFWPENQDRGGLTLITVRRRVSLPSDRPLSASEFASAMDKLSYEWASLPPSRYGQGGKSLSDLWAKYTQFGGADAVGADNCTATERDSAARYGCACVDHKPSGGYCDGSGCTAGEADAADDYGCVCVDHKPSGGYCDGSGCTAREAENAKAYGCGCVDHKPSGGYCDGSGCTARETENAKAYGCACVDHKPSGGYCEGTGCTAAETDSCAKFGCGCVDHQCQGGFCEGTGCTALETNNCAQYGCGCKEHQCAGGACEG